MNCDSETTEYFLVRSDLEKIGSSPIMDKWEMYLIGAEKDIKKYVYVMTELEVMMGYAESHDLGEVAVLNRVKAGFQKTLEQNQRSLGLARGLERFEKQLHAINEDIEAFICQIDHYLAKFGR